MFGQPPFFVFWPQTKETKQQTLSCVLLPVLLGIYYTIAKVFKDFGSYYQNVFIQQPLNKLL